MSIDVGAVLAHDIYTGVAAEAGEGFVAEAIQTARNVVDAEAVLCALVLRAGAPDEDDLALFCTGGPGECTGELIGLGTNGSKSYAGVLRDPTDLLDECET